MSREQIKGDWNQFKGRIKEHWGKLMRDEIEVVAGKRDQLIGIEQKRYGALKRNRLNRAYKNS